MEDLDRILTSRLLIHAPVMLTLNSAEHCGYGDLHDEMVRDRIVVGLCNSRLSEKLQMDPNLMLDKAMSLARQSEAVKKQQPTVRGQVRDETSIEAIHGTRDQQKQKPSQSKPAAQPHVCTRCGKAPLHRRSQCPAKEAVCHKCGKRGHYKSMCKSKPGTSVRTVYVDDANSDAFLGTIHSDAAGPWTTTLVLNNRSLEFKVDTGADVTVIPEADYCEERDGVLRASERVLTGAGQQPLQVCGQFRGILKQNHKESQQVIYVVSGLRKPLLGRPAIEGIVSLVEPVQTGDVVKEFPKLFRGLAKLKDDYTIKLRSGAKPFALTTPRRVALPLLPKVKAELQLMEDLGVISKVEQPTEWCAGMVVVPKPNGSVRICVDLTKLNESVCQERHILPSVEQTLAQIGGAKISKLDANSEFWQVELAQESSLLTTFITLFGRFCFNWMPFGITSAPEHFQRRMGDILSGLDGVVCLVDDILIYRTLGRIMTTQLQQPYEYNYLS